MGEGVWVVGFIIVLAVTIASCPVRGAEGKDKTMDGADCVKLLGELKPPLLSLKRGGYRPHVSAWVARLEMEQARGLCAFFRCDISSVVTRIMDWQYSRARLKRQARRETANSKL